MSSVLDEVLEGMEPSPDLLSVMAASKPAVVLGVDIGTSGVRAALYDASGGEINDAAVRLPRMVSGFSDLALMDAERTVELVLDTIDALLGQPWVPATPIEIVSISCFWHSLVGIDAEGRATTPILGWADTRASQVARDLRRRFKEGEVHARTGCRFHSSYWPAKLLWLRNNEPETFAATKQWLSFSDYLALRLCGETTTSVSMASGTGLLDQRTSSWDTVLLRTLGIPRQALSEIANATTTLRLKSEFALRWPQLTNARVYPAIGDGAANNIGSGCVLPNKAALMVGTSGAIRVLFEGEPPRDIPRELWCYRADRMRVVIGGALSDGGGLHSWMRQSLFFKEDQADIEGELAELEPDSHGLTILPFWAGERSPGWLSEAHGSILGLTMRTRPIEILRASMEAVAYRFALIARALERAVPGVNIIASGNALRSSPVWTQIIADVLGRPIVLSGAREASTRGAALLALEAAGKIQSLEEFCVPLETTFEPDQSRHARYQKGLERQEKAYERIARDF